MREHALQQWQRKSGGFTCAGLRGAHDILAGQDHRNGLRLNRRHGFVSHFGDRFGQMGC